jgi:hypothetical protein
VDWIGPAQDRNRWRALVNIVMYLQVPNNVLIYNIPACFITKSFNAFVILLIFSAFRKRGKKFFATPPITKYVQE